jgi:N-acetylglucosaminyldiphosphoundecaprenol N-acetyl-beta-D-mannosaminyltransferase
MTILGIAVDRVDYEEALTIFDGFMKGGGFHFIVTPNSEIVVNASKDANLKQIIAEADLVIPDGVGLVYASRMIGEPLNERVTGIDFLGKILAYLEESEQSIFFLGSKPGIAERAAEKMKEKHPKLRVAGTHDGYFKLDQETGLVAEINNSGADFLCVALGSPKQEEFLYRHRLALTMKAAIGVGGSLDVWAGTLKRAPEFYRKNGLEWLYRFLQQPSRYKRMTALPLFMLKVLLKAK